MRANAPVIIKFKDLFDFGIIFSKDSIAMAPVQALGAIASIAHADVKRAVLSAAGSSLTTLASSPHHHHHHHHLLLRRSLSVNHTQGVTLGVLCAYVVVIALLWNIPWVRWSLWPFKVRKKDRCIMGWDSHCRRTYSLIPVRYRCLSSPSMNSDTL